jgi:hypothetical protein
MAASSSAAALPPALHSVAILPNADLLRCSEPFLIHQCNCVSKGARGLAKSLFQAFPAANVYARRAGPSTPGGIDLAAASPALTVVGLFAQYRAGDPAPLGQEDSAAARLAWFSQGLEAFAARAGLPHPPTRTTHVAMPYLIGCGLAGGHWPDYLAAIEQWSQRYGVAVRLYDVDGKSLRGGGVGSGGGASSAGGGGGGGPRGPLDAFFSRR